MSYYNPKIYNKENLRDEDRIRLEGWYDIFETVVENEKDDFDESTGSETLDKIRQEIIDDFAKKVMNSLGMYFQDMLIGIIDGYSEDVPEREEYTTFMEDADDTD